MAFELLLAAAELQEHKLKAKAIPAKRPTPGHLAEIREHLVWQVAVDRLLDLDHAKFKEEIALHSY